MAYDFNSLTTFKPNSKKAARYSKVRDALSGKLSDKTRARLRKENKKLKAYMNPTDPVTGMPLKDLERSARQEAKNKYGGAIEEYGGMVRGQEQRTADIAPWYDQWRTHLTTIGQSQFQAGAQQAADMITQAGKLQNQDVAQQAQLANRAAGNAQAEPALQAARDASAGRAALAQGNAASVQERGKIRQGMQESFAGNSRLEQSRQQAISQGKTEELKKKKLGLEQDAASYFHERLDAGRQSAIEAQTQQAAAKMAGLKLGETSAHNRAMEEVAASNAESNAQRADWATSPSNPDNQAKPPKAGGKYRYTKSQRVTMSDDARRAYEDTPFKSKKLAKGKYAGKRVKGIQLYDKEGAPTSWLAATPENEKQIRKYYGDNGAKNSTMRAALAQQAIYGDVGKGTWNALRKLGINPKNVGLKLRK